MFDLIGLAGGDGFANDIQQAGRAQPGGNMCTGKQLAEGAFGRTVLKQHAGVLVENENGGIQNREARPYARNDVFAGHFRLIRLRRRNSVLCGGGRRALRNGQNGNDGAKPKGGGHIGCMEFRNGHDGEHADDENGQPVPAELPSQKP